MFAQTVGVGSPFLVLQGDVHAQNGLPVVTASLCDSLVGIGGVEVVNDGGVSIPFAVSNSFVIQLLGQFALACIGGEIRIGILLRQPVVDGAQFGYAVGEVLTGGVEDTAGYEAGSGDLSSLGYVLDDVVSVNRDGHRSTYFPAGDLVAVQVQIVSTNVRVDEAVAGALQRFDHVGREGLDEVVFAVLIRGQDRGLGVGQVPYDLIRTQVGSIVILFVGDHLDVGVVYPLGDDVGAVDNDVSGIGPVVVAFDDVFTHGHQGCERADFEEVRASAFQGDLQSLVVQGFDAQFFGSLFTGLDRCSIYNDAVQEVAVVSRGVGVDQSSPGVDPVVCGNGLAIGPEDVVPQGEGVHESVVGDGVAGGLAGNYFGHVHVGVVSGMFVGLRILHQIFEHVLDVGGTVYGADKADVDGLGF